MAVSFRMRDHTSNPGAPTTIEILIDGRVIGTICPHHENGIRVSSDNMEERTVDEGFAGEVAEDDGSQSLPPTPAVHITFEYRTPYYKGHRLIKLDDPKKP